MLRLLRFAEPTVRRRLGLKLHVKARSAEVFGA